MFPTQNQNIFFDVKRYDEDRLLELANVIGSVFFIDQKSEYEEFVRRLEKLITQFSKLNEDEQMLFVKWFNNIVLRGMPQGRAEELKKGGNQYGICDRGSNSEGIEET